MIRMMGTPVLLIMAVLFVSTSATFTEFGKLLGAFPDDTVHDVAGTIYVIDATTISVRGFSYDGTAPDAFFYGGDTTKPSGSESGSVIIPLQGEGRAVLGEYNNQNLVLSLPVGKLITDFKWISVWCRQVGADFGHVNIPEDFVAPAPLSLGTLGFPARVHDVHADEVTILNTRQIRFRNLDYDGAGPAAFFWADTTTSLRTSGTKILHPDDKGERLPRYNGVTIVVTLPEGSQISDYGSIGLWCEVARQNFGDVEIPAPLNVPLYMEEAPAPDLMLLPNCQVLAENRFHISWEVDQDAGKLRLQFIGVVDRDQYMAFGISGSETRTSMVGSDVIVVYVDEEGEAHADDYYLTEYSQCSPNTGAGACPDNLQDGGTDNATSLGVRVTRGITTITAERPLAATDVVTDKAIPLQLTYISWAMGSLNPSGHVSKHANDQRPTGNVQVDFSQESSTCPRFEPPRSNDGLKPWRIEPQTPEPAPEVIEAHIGPSGGAQGYQGISEQVGWGIAWYLNGQLVPELNVRRNCTYRFEIYGGNDNSSNTANFHPFYITSDQNGGYNQKSTEEKVGEVIYAGPKGGSLCEYKSDDNPDNFDTFEKFKKTLDMTCPDSAEPGILEWFVAEDTPDLVYYQCYQHRFFGWKINVSGASSVTMTVSLMTLLVAVAIFNLF